MFTGVCIIIYVISFLLIIYHYGEVGVGGHLLDWITLLTPGLNTLYIISLLITGRLFTYKSLSKQFKDLYK